MSARPHDHLRVGLIVRETFQREVWVTEGTTVTVGPDPTCTLVVDPEVLAVPWEVCRWRSGAWEMLPTPGVSGRIRREEEVVRAEQAREPVALPAGCRGRLTLGEVGVLFQAVKAPTHAVASIPTDYRAPWIEEDDPLFLGSLGLWTALAAVMVLWVSAAPPRAIQSLEEASPRIAKLLYLQPPPVEPVEIEVTEAEGETPEAEPETPDPSDASEAGPSEAPEDAGTSETSQEALRDQVLEQSALLQILGTTGAHNNGQTVLQGLASDDGGRRFDLSGVSQVEIAAAGTLRGSQVDDEGDLDCGEACETLEIGEIGEVRVTDEPQVEVTGRVDLPTEDPNAPEGTNEVGEVVRKFRGQVQYCYERVLKGEPSLEGRLEVEWSVSGGRARSVTVFANTTGSNDLADCVVERIERWRFPNELDLDVYYPFVFRPQH